MPVDHHLSHPASRKQGHSRRSKVRTFATTEVIKRKGTTSGQRKIHTRRDPLGARGGSYLGPGRQKLTDWKVPNLGRSGGRLGLPKRSVRPHERAAGFRQREGARKWPGLGRFPRTAIQRPAIGSGHCGDHLRQLGDRVHVAGRTLFSHNMRSRVLAIPSG
jgi:hypothetical protein